jgi:hypothetical protein
MFTPGVQPVSRVQKAFLKLQHFLSRKLPLWTIGTELDQFPGMLNRVSDSPSHARNSEVGNLSFFCCKA